MPDRVTFTADEPLPLTGERTAPDIADENYWFQRHLVAYGFVARLVAGAKTLDAGCGEGYGADLLAGSAAQVTGLDLEEPVLARARQRYPKVGFVRGDLQQMPLPDRHLEALVTLQVIEHLPSPRVFLSECHRVLRPGGLIIVGTPNRLTFSPGGVVRNPFHTVEFDASELSAALDQRFESIEMLGVFHGPRIKRWELAHRASLPETLIEQPAPNWPSSLRRRVHDLSVNDFAIRAARIDRSLDLLAIARAR
ncbi:MAG: class I SAM-dependent methyltransferase [Actinomycetota bacterium]